MTTVGEVSKAKGIDVVVRAMIGRGEQLLLIRHPKEGHWYLPGGQVDPGKPAETALRQKITNALDTEIESASFLALVEHGYSDRHGNDHHELNLIFDVTISKLDMTCANGQREVQWIHWEELSAIDLRPVGLRAGLRSGRFDTGDRWLPWGSPTVY